MAAKVTRAKRIRRFRNLVAISSLTLLNLQFLNVFFPNLALSGLRCLSGPVFFCHSCPWATVACPIGVLVNFGTLRIFPFVTLGILGLIGTFGGRIVCGWICPFGWLQDLLHKIPTRKFQTPKSWRYTKYALLAITVIAIPYFFPHKPWTFCDYCPSGTLESMYPWAFVGHWNVESGLFGGFTVRFFARTAVLLGVLILAVFVSRGFCRVFCPIGAIFGLFNRFSLFRYKLTYNKCNGCAACAKVCPVDIDPVKQMNDAECIRCYECTNTKHIKMGVE
jgi:ferredoxin-type protein NapH